MNVFEITTTAQKIENYLLQRPNATDTVEGIHNWWINSLGTISATKSALEQLEEDGTVEQYKIGNSVVWRRKRFS